ncbi:hypothetical protein JXO52_02450 [bacterium]|nr:hypothetical protein [bacterium]
MDPTPVYIFAGIAAVIIVVVLFVSRQEKKRREALRMQAQTYGFAYTEKAELEWIGEAGHLHLFTLGHRRRIHNLMFRDSVALAIRVFDYQFTVGGGQNSHTYRQTVFQFDSGGLHLPPFIIRPENVFHKIGKAFGYQDINFDAFPEFSSIYLLRGENEEMIRRIFNQEIIDMFVREKGLIVEGKGPVMICYRSGKRVKPEELGITLEHMQTLAQAFVRRCAYA